MGQAGHRIIVVDNDITDGFSMTRFSRYVDKYINLSGSKSRSGYIEGSSMSFLNNFTCQICRYFLWLEIFIYQIKIQILDSYPVPILHVSVKNGHLNLTGKCDGLYHSVKT